jgi:PAS domain S-box-containing protein
VAVGLGLDEGDRTGVRGGPSPDPSPRKLRAERGEFDRASTGFLPGRGAPAARATLTQAHRTVRHTPPPQFGGGVASRREERAKGLAGERASRGSRQSIRALPILIPCPPFTPPAPRWPSSCRTPSATKPPAGQSPVSPTPEARHRENDAQFGHARDGVAVLSRDWRFRYANASLLEILNLMGGRDGVETFWDAIPGWDQVPEADRLRGAMDSRTPITFRFDRRPQVPHVWEVAAEPLDSGDLRVRLRNVTSQVEVEELRQHVTESQRSWAERERRLVEIVTGAPVALALVEAESSVVVEANEAYAELLDEPWNRPGAVVGHAMHEFLPGYYDDGVADLLARVRATGETWEGEEFEYRGFRRGPAWFRLTIKPVGAEDGGPVRYLLLLAVEVTTLVRARHRVEAERRALYDVVDTLPVGIVVAEAASGRITWLNPAAVALAGRAADELLAPDQAQYAARWQVFTPAGQPYPPDALPLSRALAGEATRDVEMVLRHPDGSERTVLGSGVPLRDAGGRVERGMVVFYDITDRLKLERALIERTNEAEHAAANAALREEESRALREMGRALVSSLEPVDVLRLAAQNALELLGARGSFFAAPVPGEAEILVSPALGVLAEMEGMRTPLPGSAAEVVLREGTQVYNAPDRIPATSPLLPMMQRVGARNLLVVPVRAYGEALGVLGVVDRGGGFGAEDARVLEAFADSAALAVHNARLYAGERQRAEVNRALLQAAEALTSTLDPEEVMERIVSLAGELVGADGAGLTVLTGEKEEEIRVTVASGLLQPLRGLSGASAGSLTEAAFERGVPTTFSASDAEPHAATGWMRRLGVEHYAVFPLRTGQERLGMLGLVRGDGRPPFTRDELATLALLGDQAALAVRNARLYEGAQAASRAKSEFVAVMSHELRTPLNALAGYSSLLEEGIYGPVTDEQRAVLGRMRGSREHLVNLIDQVLDVARVEAGTKRARPEPVSLRDLVRDVCEALRGAVDARGLSLDVQLADVPTTQTDAGMVRQVLTNLIGNAVKFTGTGGITVRLYPCGDGACVDVADTGPGIPPGLQERAFEPFVQLDPSTTRREGGVGLGLALSREFARLLGGTLTLRSTPGEGSTFTLRLPAEPVQAVS